MSKRLAVLIPDELHKQLWKMARRRNITLTRYVTRALLRYILDEQRFEGKEDDAQQKTIMLKI